MFQKGHFIRQELNGPLHRVTIVDGAKKTLLMLDEASKTYTETDLAKGSGRDLSGADTAACADKADPVKCFVELGFKKVGDEQVNGYDCDVYERAEDPQHPGSSKIWHPKTLKKLPFVRMTMQGARGGGQIDLSNIQEKTLDAKLFVVPDGYKKRESPAMPPHAPAGALPPGFDPSKPPTPEQIQELLKKYGK